MSLMVEDRLVVSGEPLRQALIAGHGAARRASGFPGSQSAVELTRPNCSSAAKPLSHLPASAARCASRDPARPAVDSPTCNGPRRTPGRSPTQRRLETLRRSARHVTEHALVREDRSPCLSREFGPIGGDVQNVLQPNVPVPPERLRSDAEGRRSERSNG